MTESAPSYRLRPFRHRTGSCSRLLFEAALMPGTWLRIRCPACGKMHEIRVNSTGVACSNGHNLTSNTP